MVFGLVGLENEMGGNVRQMVRSIIRYCASLQLKVCDLVSKNE